MDCLGDSLSYLAPWPITFPRLNPKWMGLRFILVLLAAAGVAGPALSAQSANRIAGKIDSAQVRVLPNHHPLWAVSANDAGTVPANQAFESLTLVLARSPEQEQAFEQFLAGQQNPASPDYEHWLTPDEVGQRFGLSDQDVAAITGWLQSQGLHVNWVAPNRVFIGFGGTAADIGRAFQTEMHYYKGNGPQRHSVNSDPMIPAALAPAIKAVRGLYTIDEQPNHRVSALQSASPQLTASDGSHYVTPADFNTIYDVPSSLTGAGTTIGIVSWSRTNPADFNNFRSKTGATFSNPTEVVPTAYGGIDPGPALTSPPSGSSSTLGGQEEATLDVLRAGSVAPAATLLLVVSSPSGSNDGIGADAQYLVNTKPVPAQVMNISFGACESSAGAGGVAFWDNLFQIAAGEGISVFVSSGDSGASGCDTSFSAPPSSPKANSPNYICSSSYATCAGGTEFADSASPSTYWSSSNGAGYLSAFGYIPEGAWNESTSTSVAATGGGVSTVIATPSWQTGTGVPSARAGRYTPDVSFSASAHDGYFACMAAISGGSCVTSGGSFGFIIFSGTSAAAPGMAGVAALLDQKFGSPRGNLNPQLYPLAASVPAAFHDATVSSSGVSGCSVNTASMCNNSIPNASGSGAQAGFLLNTGYDEATGLGSLDVQVFLNNYTAPKIIPTVTVTPASSSITTAQPLSVTVVVNGGSGNPTPTGSVTLTGGGYSSAPATLSSGSATINIPAGSLAPGSDTLTASYTPDSSSSSTYNSASGSAPVTVSMAAAAITSPAPGSTLTSALTTFTWNTGPGSVTGYYLWVGTTPGGLNLVNIGPLSGPSTTVNLPTNGSTIYVRLWTVFNGTTYLYNDYTYTAASVAAAATITSPVPGATLTAASTTFTWNTGPGSVTGYYLWVGTTPGGLNLVNIGPLSGTSATVNLPTNGATVYVRLWTVINGATYVYNDYTYTAASAAAAATITSPAPGTTLTAASTTFTWSAGPSGTTGYYLWIGTSPGALNLVNIGPLPGTSATVNLPTNGSTIYVRLWTVINGTTFVYNDYTYTAASAAAAATITSPAPGSTLTSASTTFTWSAGPSGTTGYYLWIGTSPGGLNLVNIGPLSGPSATVNLPTNGATVYVRLWTVINGTTYVYNDYTYTEFH
jgi:pseudomonalisin